MTKLELEAQREQGIIIPVYRVTRFEPEKTQASSKKVIANIDIEPLLGFIYDMRRNGTVAWLVWGESDGVYRMAVWRAGIEPVEEKTKPNLEVAEGRIVMRSIDDTDWVWNEAKRVGRKAKLRVIGKVG